MAPRRWTGDRGLRGPGGLSPRHPARIGSALPAVFGRTGHCRDAQRDQRCPDSSLRDTRCTGHYRWRRWGWGWRYHRIRWWSGDRHPETHKGGACEVHAIGVGPTVHPCTRHHPTRPNGLTMYKLIAAPRGAWDRRELARCGGAAYYRDRRSARDRSGRGPSSSARGHGYSAARCMCRQARRSPAIGCRGI